MRRQDIAMMPNRATWTRPCAAGRRKGAGSAKTPNIFDWVLPFFSMDLGKTMKVEYSASSTRYGEKKGSRFYDEMGPIGLPDGWRNGERLHQGMVRHYRHVWPRISRMKELWDLETFPPLPRMMAMIQHRNMDDGAISSSKGARSGPAGST